MTKHIKENGKKYKIVIEGLDGKNYFSIVYHMHHQIDYSNNSYGKDFCNKIIEMSKVNNGPIACILKKHAPELLQNIVAKTKFIDEAIQKNILNDHLIQASERIYCILNDITTIPSCPKCGKPLKNFTVKKRTDTHYEFCSRECAITADTTVQLRVHAFNNRSDEAKQATRIKKENTCLQRFGSTKFMNSNYFKQKSLEYVRANGGICNVSQIKEVRRKVIDTNMQHFGCCCNLASEETLQKKKESYIARYGVDHHMKNKDFRKKFFDSFKEKYGCRSPFQLPNIIKQNRINVLQKTINILKSNEHVTPLFKLDAEEMHQKNFKCMDQQYWWQCNDCGHVFASEIISIHGEYVTIYPFCQIEKARSMRNHSKAEIELAEFLRQELKGFKVINGNNKINRHIIPPYEIDIWLPDLNIGIEFDGTFWHSIEYAKKSKKSNYMYAGLKKTIICEKKRIHLIHVYEDEWLFKKQQTKQLLVDIINGKDHIELDDDILEIPRDLYPSWIQIPGYEFIEFTLPKLQPRCNSKGKIYHVVDCGNMIFKRI